MSSLVSIARIRLLPCLVIASAVLCVDSEIAIVHGDEKSVEAREVDVLSEQGQRQLQDQFAQVAERLTQAIAKSPDSIALHSQRGDARFFRRDFPEAVADYERMLKLQPDLDAKHWRLGLAWFYAGKYAEGAKQFEKYYETDDIDRENGLWRFLCQAREQGLAAARQKMLKYVKPDRGGLGDVYRMYAGELTADQILTEIKSRKLDEEERNQRLFYGELYIGLYESVQNHHEAAVKHLQAAVRNPWPRLAGYGPNYMWQVARLHCVLEQDALKKAATSKSK